MNKELSLTDLIIIKTALEVSIEHLKKADLDVSVQKNTLDKITDMFNKK